MITWYKLKVGGYELKYSPLKPTPQSFPKCDKNGNILEEKPKAKSKTYWEKFDSEPTFRLINGKPRAKLNRTKEVNNFLMVEGKEVEDLLSERFYVVDCPLLLDKLRAEKKAFKFAFSFGNGFKVYLAYIHTSKIYKDILFMTMGTAQKSELIKEIAEDITNKSQPNRFEIDVLGVNRATAEELIELKA